LASGLVQVGSTGFFQRLAAIADHLCSKYSEGKIVDTNLQKLKSPLNCAKIFDSEQADV
jgi:hypothetical protein